MSSLTFRDYTAGLLLVVVSIGLMLNFSASMFDVYNSDVDSKTLQKVKKQADQQTAAGDLENRTSDISVNTGSFLSPQGFGVVKQVFNTATSIPNIFGTAIAELGFPPVLVLLSSIIVFALIWEVVSILFGIRT